MNVWNLPSRWRPWAARSMAVLGIALGAVPALRSSHFSFQLLLWLAVDAAALWLCGKRRFRFAAALWFGGNAFFQLLTFVDHSGELPGWRLASALAMSLATALLVWPMLRAPSEQARLAPLSGVWVLVATLVLTTLDAALFRASGALPRDSAFIAGASALGLFAGCALASQWGPLRWPVQLLTAGLIGAAHTSELRSFISGEKPAMELAHLVTWLGLATFALGLDWIRAGVDGRTRFLRAGALSFGVSALPLALAAFWSPVGVEAVGMAMARAAALGLAAAIMPRVAGRGWPLLRLGSPVGVPPWPLMALVLGVGVVAIFLVRDGESALAIAVSLVPAFVCMVLRTRFTRASLFLMGGIPLLVGSFGAVKVMESGVLSALSLAALALFGFCLSGPAAGRHFRRRWRAASIPRPRVSLALAGVAALALAAPVLTTTFTRPQARSGLLASAGGSVPLPLPIYFRGGELRDAPSPGRLTGSTVVVDPKGRGTWLVDEERDEVALVSDGGELRRFPVGDWPELLVVTSEGRVFVSCREAARIDVIEPDFQRRAIELDDEVRGLALDPSERRLYAGLVLSRTLEAFDAQTLERVGRVQLETDPRSVAVTAEGVATLPDRGSAVEMVSEDLQRHWSVPLPSSGDGVAWHGQALLPAGRDLLVLHAQVNTGLERPSSGGGYGGSVSQPIELVATVLEGGRAPLIPPNARAMTGSLGIPDVSGAALGDGALYLASRIKGQVQRVPFAIGGHLDFRGRTVVADLASKEEPAVDQFEPEIDEREETAVASGNGLTGLALDGGRVVTFAAFDRVLISAAAKDTKGTQRVEAKLGAGRMDEQLARGRRLFFRNDRTVSSAGMACASCHVDGREDGLVWRLQGGRLQTPSLTGRLADSAPYNWHGTTKDLPDNIAQTIERLGGSGLSGRDRKALARYLTEGLRPVRAVPARVSSEPALVAQGRTLFHDRTVGCASCHDSATGFTDGQAHDVESLSKAEREELLQATANPPPATASAFDTPTLRQVGLTAPYFHDGSAKTLEALVDENRDRMGKTSHLSTDERRALVAYLRTL